MKETFQYENGEIEIEVKPFFGIFRAESQLGIISFGVTSLEAFEKCKTLQINVLEF